MVRKEVKGISLGGYREISVNSLKDALYNTVDKYNKQLMESD